MKNLNGNKMLTLFFVFVMGIVAFGWLISAIVFVSAVVLFLILFYLFVVLSKSYANKRDDFGDGEPLI